MRLGLLSVKMVVVFGLAARLPPAFGGTIITANLPADTVIVNISGTQDGAASYSGPNQAYWYHPFSTGGAAQLLEYTVPAGTYGFRVIDPTDALMLFPALTPSLTSQMFTAWTYNSPWTTDYVVFDSAAATNTSLPQLFDGAFSNTNGIWYTYTNATNAYNAAIAGGFYNLIRSGINGREGTNGQPGTVISTSYTFNTSTTLIFAVPDYQLNDNNGGVSVLISPATATAPLPILSIFPGSGVVTLRWPTNAVGFNLTQTTNFLPAAWNYVTNVPTVVITNFSVTLPDSFTSRFFRLQNP